MSDGAITEIAALARAAGADALATRLEIKRSGALTVAVAGVAGQGRTALIEALAGELELIDTPSLGTGPQATRIALAAAGTADVLVFVTDAFAPISAPELRFVEQAALRTTRIVVAVTKIDDEPEWRAVVAENRGLVGDHAVVGVSSRLVTTRPERSGIAALRAALCLDPAGVRRANRRLAGRRAAAGLAAAERARLGARPDLEAACAAHRERLAALDHGAALWPTQLGDDLARLEGALSVEFGRLVKAVEQRFDDAGVRAFARSPDALADALRTELRAVGAEIDRRARVELEEIEGRLADTVGITERGRATSLALGELEADLIAEEIQGGDWARAARLVQSAISPGMVGTSLARIGVLGSVGVVALPVGIALGGVVALEEWRQLKQGRRARPLVALVREALYHTRNEFPAVMRDQLRALRRDLELRVREHVTAERRAIQAALAALDSERAQDDRDREAHRAERLARIDRFIDLQHQLDPRSEITHA